MNLLHVTATHLNPVGGIPVVLKNLVESQNAIENLNARVLSIVAPVNLINSNYFDFLGNGSFSDYLDKFKPNVVIFHGHFYFSYLWLYQSCLKRKIPYFIEPHGAFGYTSLKKSRWKKIIVNNLVLRRYIKKAKGFIFLNNRELLNSRFRTANDVIIPNGIVMSDFNESNHKNDAFSLYYIGRYDINHKGLDRLFDAFDILESRSKSINIDFYGKGSPKAEKYLKKRSENYKTVKVQFKHPIYGEEQENKLNQKGVMVLVSRYEGFPMTILEAWKYGNPCIVTEETNVAEEIVKNGLGWVTSLSADSIANTIEQAVKEYTSNSMKYIQNCKFFAKNYEWSKIAFDSFCKLNKSIEQ